MFSGAFVSAETEKEKEKRRNSLYLKYAREKYDRLYDHRVLINKTVIAACDRTRATYQLQVKTTHLSILVYINSDSVYDRSEGDLS